MSEHVLAGSLSVETVTRAVVTIDTLPQPSEWDDLLAFLKESRHHGFDSVRLRVREGIVVPKHVRRVAGDIERFEQGDAR